MPRARVKNESHGESQNFRYSTTILLEIHLLVTHSITILTIEASCTKDKYATHLPLPSTRSRPKSVYRSYQGSFPSKESPNASRSMQRPAGNAAVSTTVGIGGSVDLSAPTSRLWSQTTTSRSPGGAKAASSPTESFPVHSSARARNASPQYRLCSLCAAHSGFWNETIIIIDFHEEVDHCSTGSLGYGASLVQSTVRSLRNACSLGSLVPQAPTQACQETSSSCDWSETMMLLLGSQRMGFKKTS